MPVRRTPDLLSVRLLSQLTADAVHKLWLRFIHMAADGVLATHWTRSGGIGLHEGSIGAIGLVGGICTAWLRWKNMA